MYIAARQASLLCPLWRISSSSWCRHRGYNWYTSFLYFCLFFSSSNLISSDFINFKTVNATLFKPTANDPEEPEIVIEASTPVVQLSTGDYFRIICYIVIPQPFPFPSSPSPSPSPSPYPSNSSSNSPSILSLEFSFTSTPIFLSFIVVRYLFCGYTRMGR